MGHNVTCTTFAYQTLTKRVSTHDVLASVGRVSE